MNSSIARTAFLSACLAIGCISVSSSANARDNATTADAQQSAHLLAGAALAGPLTKGLVVIAFSTENIELVAKYGEAAQAITPRIGHLHISVDDAAWHWVHSNNEPVVVQGLATGSHRITLELMDANHGLIETKTIAFEIGLAHAH